VPHLCRKSFISRDDNDGVKFATVTVIAGIAAASMLSVAARGTPKAEPRIVFRTVHLATPKRPPELYSVVPSGESRRLLVRGGDQPAWSPSRTRIAFAGGGILGREGIWVMNASGSARRRLTSRAGDGDPTWSPDGRRIVYRRDNGTNFDLWIVAAAGGKPAPLLQSPRANELTPDWSPDGRRIAFESTRSGEIQIWVYNLRRRQARQITRGKPSFSPDWAPDNRRIAYATSGRIAIVDADRPRPRLLSSGTPRSVDSPAWSPDGKRIAFQRGGQVLSMRAAGGDLRYVTRAAWGTNGDPDW
jgi:Tol biopolymer transport system component